MKHIAWRVAKLGAEWFEARAPWACGNRRYAPLPPPEVFPELAGHPMHAQGRGLRTLDREDADEPEQPCGLHERWPAGPRPLEPWETGGMEPWEKIPTRLADPCAGTLAGGAGGGHGALLSAEAGPILPQPALLVKCRHPSNN